jgi:hypothetical protein
MGSTDSKTRDLKVADFIEQGFAMLPSNNPTFVREASQPATINVEASPVSAAPLPPTEENPNSIKFTLPPRPKKK